MDIPTEITPVPVEISIGMKRSTLYLKKSDGQSWTVEPLELSVVKQSGTS